MQELEPLVEKIQHGRRILFIKTEKTMPDFEINILKMLTERSKGIVLLANKDCRKLVDYYKAKGINMTNLAIFSTAQNAHADAEHVSSLTEASLLMTERINKLKGKKFVIIDALHGLLKAGGLEISEKFIHYLLTKMRIEKIGGLVVSGKVNRKEIAGIIQLFDEVAKA